MATITKIERPTGAVYKARIRKAGRGQISQTFKFRSDAEKWARKEEAAVERDDSGLTTQGQRHTLADAIDRYLTERLPELAPGTREIYTAHLEHWRSKLGHLKLSELHPGKIAVIRDELRAAGRQPSSCNRYLAALAAVLTRCVKHWHWLQLNPVSQVAKLKEDNARKRFLSEGELQALLAACRDSASPDLLLLVLLAISTGARRGELLALRWMDVDWDKATLQLRTDNETDTKGGVRVLPIAGAVLPLLKARKEARAEKVARLRDDRLIFPSRVSPKQPVEIRNAFAKAVERAGLGDFHFHDLRHSAASFLAMSGASLREIGEVLGHRCTQTTRRYAHLAESHTHSKVREMADRLLGQGQVEPS
ncbi:tyrosine-type recombinase/integrase [Allochromatium vinosum]|uniref:tyrosine-type recombinase/integrase n=1 Tax=Allochromatium vinosum TaxID=1049 RepID=UPI0019043506|nr:site-specific integrase [Allochromatium vinosum]MBK1655236.1 integrase [Allochromatium vinosum]